MQFARRTSLQPVYVASSSALAEGGEARIFPIQGDGTLIAKIYHEPTRERAAKLISMLANPPADPTAARGHVSIAWPLDMLIDARISIPVGFLMPYVRNAKPVYCFFNPGERKKHCHRFNYKYLMTAAYNLAYSVAAVHERGYVIGDVNQSNILVTDTAEVTLVDTDSFQIRDTSHADLFRCPVYTAAYTPPEIQRHIVRGVSLAQIDRTPEHDCFGLAVLIFQLLMEGTHPFDGVFVGAGEPPDYEESIQDGYFAYSQARRVPLGPRPTAPPIDLLGPRLQHLLFDCFDRGHLDPAARPSARLWRETLSDALDKVVICPLNTQHLYPHHLQRCPWCIRMAQLGGRDPFPSVGGHLGGKTRGRHRPAQTLRPASNPAAVPTPLLGHGRNRHVRGWVGAAAAPRAYLQFLTLNSCLLTACGTAAILAFVPALRLWAGVVAVATGILISRVIGKSKWIKRSAVVWASAMLLLILLPPTEAWISKRLAGRPPTQLVRTDSPAQSDPSPTAGVADPLAGSGTSLPPEADQLRRAQTLADQGQFQEAIRICDGVPKTNPTYPKATALKAEIVKQMNAATADRTNKAKEFFKASNLAAATRELDVVLRIDRTNGPARSLKARIAATQQVIEARSLERAARLPEALEASNRAIALDPTFQEARTLNNQVNNAIDAQAASHLQTAGNLFRQSDFAGAIKECDLVLQMSPNNSEASLLKKRVSETMAILKVNR